MKNKWIDANLSKPKLNEEVLVWVGDDSECFDIARYSPLVANNNGFLTNLTPNNYRDITHWQYLPDKPKQLNK